MNKQEELAYLAGITDGEGHFYKPSTANGRGEHHRYSRIVISQKDRRLLEWIKNRWGGSISLNRETGVSAWALQGKRAETLAKKLRPYLIVKDEQVKRVL